MLELETTMGNKRNRRNRSAKKADLGPIDLRKSLKPEMSIVKSPVKSPKKKVRFSFAPPPPLPQRECQWCEEHFRAFDQSVCDACLGSPYGGQWKHGDWHSFFDADAHDIPLDPLQEVLSWRPVIYYPAPLTSIGEMRKFQEKIISKVLRKRK